MEFFASFMPHGHCYLWTPSILWTMVASDALIALSYFSIPLALVTFTRRREDLPFSWIFLLFGLFILACGTGHVLDVWNTWHGNYGAESIVKAVTAAASIGTAAALWPLLPRVMALPSPAQLQAANDALQREVETRRAAEEAQRDQARELAVARDAALAASLAKSQFLANMSHEIRTPLNAVIGLTEMVLNSDLSEQQRDHLRTVQDSGDALLHVVNDILDFSKIEAGRTELEAISFDLEDAVGDALRSLAIRASRKDLELLLRIEARVPRRLRGDPSRLRQVITNLVSNAITYTAAGEVEVAVDCVSPDEPTHLRFEVRDTGMGIAAEDLERLFDPFEQADQSSTRRFGGTGLGLSICRGIVHLMAGEIGATSQPGEGSTFSFTARFAQGDAPSERGASAPRLDGVRTLIVDDNETNRVILYALARRRGLQPVLAGSASEAFALLGNAVASGEPFSLLLSDVQMPGVDGLDLVERIRAQERFAGLTAVLLSSAGSPPDAQRCERLQVAARLAKPIKEHEFSRMLGELVGGADASNANDASQGDAPEPEVPPLRILLVEDSVANQKVALAMLRDTHEVEVASDGAEAVRMFQSGGAFDVVLMDVQMPVMDGYASTAAIRASERDTGGRVPIVAMTAHAMEGDRERCLVAGMDDYLSKPIRRIDLMRALARVRGGAADQLEP
jgi:signal transduction histidine kinase/CheY-like chemotaxis protein